MVDQEIYNLVYTFRDAVIAALNANRFNNDINFKHFPKRCCGDTCCLLAEFLLSNGYKTIYVWGDYQDQSHAWLVLKDFRVKEPIRCYYEPPMEIRDILNTYSNNAYINPIDITKYEENDLADGIIIDITSDQFGEEPVYIGYTNSFYKKFSFVKAVENNTLSTSRLKCLYRTIMEFIN